MRFACLLLLSSPLLAAPVDFVRDVRPIFQTHCYECHSEKKQKAGGEESAEESAEAEAEREYH